MKADLSAFMESGRPSDSAAGAYRINVRFVGIYLRIAVTRSPEYSPDLNPIEQVWRITRKENTHNVFFSSKLELATTVDSAFDEWSKPNEQLRTLCSFK